MDGKKIIITQSNYIPWKGYFDAINQVDEFIVFDDMQYTKRDWRNRNKIQTAQGLQWLTVPVEVKGKYFQKINETIVSDKKWGQNHWKTIMSNYSKAPYFKEFKDAFEEIYLNDSWVFLTDINFKLIQVICEILEINTIIIDSREFELVEGKTERLIDICKKRDAKHYYTGPAAKEYIENEYFLDEGISLNYFDYGGYPEYKQLHEPFSHNVSVLDLIFNCGNNSKQYLKSFCN
jgi:hypothetical protein